MEIKDGAMFRQFLLLLQCLKLFEERPLLRDEVETIASLLNLIEVEPPLLDFSL